VAAVKAILGTHFAAFTHCYTTALSNSENSP